jgi:predicted enzyme related to lactoylglutathione lyase
MSGLAVRYIVEDVDKAAQFYCRDLGFAVEVGPGPGFVALRRDDLVLYLNQPGAGAAGASLPDGTVPRPGGWSRFQLSVDDLDVEVGRLTAVGAHFRGDVVTGRGGRQILLEDPSGNLVELFEPGSTR